MQTDISISGYVMWALPIHKLPQGNSLEFHAFSILVASNLNFPLVSSWVFLNAYRSIQYKVDVEESPAVAMAENVRILPTFKIYKNGSRVKEMVCPSPEVLESSVRHYSF